MELRTRVRSTMMRFLTSEAFVGLNRTRARVRRRLSGGKPVVHYFHEVADPFSHLAVQKLDALREKYDVEFRVHLTTPERSEFQGDPERYPDWARHDAASVAPGFGVDFPSESVRPTEAAVNSVIAELVPLAGNPEFSEKALELGTALWKGASNAQEETQANCDEANRLRRRMGHYAGAMFWFDGEWYWGLDRMELLERRLVDEGYGSGDPIVPQPSFQAPAGCDALKLEVFPSLRSPYTAISFDRICDLADRTGIEFVIRPVMPMMMRGVPAPGGKPFYVMMDSAREGRRYDTPFGRIVDPFGPPVILGFSLFPLAERAGRAREFISRYLRAAWMEGIDITKASGLRKVVEDIGLDWAEAEKVLGGDEAEAVLEDNVNEMLTAGLWGVPSFRVSGGDAPPFSCWGQDRLWRVEQEIERRMKELKQ